VTTEPKKFR
jgi:uracil phosphoribosyltransferase